MDGANSNFLYMLNKDQIDKIQKIRESLDKNNFSARKWSQIVFQDDKRGVSPQLIITKGYTDDQVKLSGVKLEDVSFLIHFRDDIEILLNFFDQVQEEKDLKTKWLDFVNSDKFQVIRWRDDFASKAPWKYSLEGRDHFAGDSVIFTEDSGNIYIFGISDIEQDFIAHCRNDLSELIKIIVEICGTKEEKVSEKKRCQVPIL